jgi:hypothetical protein
LNNTSYDARTLTTAEDSNQAASLRGGGDIANDTGANGNGRGTSSGLQSSESHELTIVVRDSQGDIGNNVYTKCSNENYTAAQNIGERTPKAWGNALNNHVYCDGEGSQRHGDTELLW